jgi:hypothetical protein
MTELYLPPEQRIEILREYGKRFNLGVFIESGTAEGFTLWGLRHDFGFIHTIEIEEHLYHRAVDRFASYPNVHCWLGDSPTVLPQILEEIAFPALIWLDGHWCQHGNNPNGPDTPVREELPIVLGDGRPHIVLVDDARLFREGLDWETEKYDYPTLTWVQETAESFGYTYLLKDDVIRLTP